MTTTERSSSGRVWPYAVVGLLAMNAVIVGITVYAASSDRSFAVVPGYYEKASRWDDEVRARQRESAMGWALRMEVGSPDLRSGDRLLIATLTDRHGESLSDVSLKAEAFHNASARDRVTLDFAPTGRPGELACTLHGSRPGLWTFDFAARRGKETWSQSSDIEVSGVSR
ncbi:hypothetical protein PHYC_00088 [Phycisphaerales bacterium]|nr:hypothetical protein PHYC_00088 [Phycisphaerales bacterium]